MNRSVLRFNSSHAVHSVPSTAVAALIGAILALGSAGAEEWIIVGPRAMGMGGAGVAVTRGGRGMYWNPAALGLRPPAKTFSDSEEDFESEVEETPEGPSYDLGFHFTAIVGDSGNTVDTVGDINDLIDALDFENLENKFQTGTPFTEQELQDSLRLLEELSGLDERGDGMIVEGAAVVDWRTWRIGFSVGSFLYGGAQPIVDLVNGLSLGNQGIDDILTGLPAPGPGQLNGDSQAFADSLAAQGLATQAEAEAIALQAQNAGINAADPNFQSAVENLLTATQNADGSGSLADALTANQSGARLRGAIMNEVAVGYGHPIGDWFAIGAATRFIYGVTFLDPLTLGDFGGKDNFFDDLFDSDNREETFNIAVDAGVLVRPFDWLVLGVTGKNLNQPEFDFHTGEEFKLDPQGRAGIGIMPLPWLTIAADIDLWENDSDVLPGFESQVVGGGVEFNLFDTVFLRGGVSDNFRDSDEPVLLHAGLAVRFWYLTLDAAVVVPSDLSELEELSNLDDKVEEIRDVPDRVGASFLFGVNIPF